MKARILRKRERKYPSGNVEWFGEVQFSDNAKCYGFTWKKTDWYRYGGYESLILRTEVKPTNPLAANARRAHSKSFPHKKERQQALLEALIELELYWDAMDV